MSTKISEIKPIEYSCKGKIITFNAPLIMGIVNITPDSFYDGGKYSTVKDVLNDVEEKIKQGAHIIDIGAASTRPNAIELSDTEEWERLKENLNEIRKTFPNTLISVDTYRASIAKQSAEYGADIINDIGGGNLDKNMFATVAELDLPYVLMHIQGTPQTMQINPHYQNVLQEIKSNFELKIELLAKLNFKKIILDPGFGFGKTLENNYTLLKGIDQFSNLGFPILAGISRKAMINKVIGTNPVTALNGTTVLNTIALLNGAQLLRVHDVSEAKQAIELTEFYKNA
ncbi:dihydropteroate synthase [Aurantibacillus circumpalustris]|uniref:dihydropteroate synthase n=1 Tax=Aurantibacillus circumpalustris TaxID=3036359 RepID=UPI00295C0207|nr:dihydropteroate synthase [Aurantibacillus circumpalustris]